MSVLTECTDAREALIILQMQEECVCKDGLVALMSNADKLPPCNALTTNGRRREMYGIECGGCGREHYFESYKI